MHAHPGAETLDYIVVTFSRTLRFLRELIFIKVADSIGALPLISSAGCAAPSVRPGKATPQSANG
jgi:hypothetical protein